MSKKLIKVAIAYDFDGTLAPGNMQEHSFLPSLGINAGEFWAKAKAIARENDMDEILAYMQLTLDEARKRDMPIRKKDFENYGKEITFFDGVQSCFDGVQSWFDRINKYAHDKGLSIEHYIISSGLREFINGTSIARHFTGIYASGFRYDVNGVAHWPALAINYTNKTQYLFRINKGINNSYDNTTINKFIPENERPIPFSRMIYIGDGETDVPAMKMVKYQGGATVAVYNPKVRAQKGKISPKQICENLIEQNRADHIAPADYSESSDLDRTVKLILDKIYINAELGRLSKTKNNNSSNH